ncbi:MAG: hypothetical protein QOF20_2521 [Acidimicrobiaceae bacterium]|nr:hypothetical protein [Acidimicrobiaceae bacterium]
MKMALNGAGVGGPADCHGQDLAHLGGGAGRVLAFQRLRQVKDVAGNFRRRGPGLGFQRLEPAFAPRPDPLIDRRAAHPDLDTARPDMSPRCQVAHQASPLGVGQLRVGRLSDQCVTE